MKLWFCPECGIVRAYPDTQDHAGFGPFCNLHSETWPDGTFSRTVPMEFLDWRWITKSSRAETPVRRETETPSGEPKVTAKEFHELADQLARPDTLDAKKIFEEASRVIDARKLDHDEGLLLLMLIDRLIDSIHALNREGAFLDACGLLQRETETVPEPKRDGTEGETSRE